MSTLRQDNIKFSIIMPIYNMEDYLRSSIESVIQQSFKNWELILVNDGSTDETETILDAYSQRDSRITVINKENTGVSESRNIGLQSSTGDYVLFMDADDLYKIDALETISRFIKTDTDMIMFDYENREIDPINELEIPSYQFLKYTLLNRVKSYVWQFAIKKSILSKADPFDTQLPMLEDMMWLVNLLKYVSKIDYVKEQLYIYQYRFDSAINSISLKKIQSMELASNKLESTIKNDYPRELDLFKIWARNMNITLYFHYALLGWPSSSLKREIRDKVLESKTEGLPRKYKLLFLLIKLHLMDIVISITKRKEKK